MQNPVNLNEKENFKRSQQKAIKFFEDRQESFENYPDVKNCLKTLGMGLIYLTAGEKYADFFMDIFSEYTENFQKKLIETAIARNKNEFLKAILEYDARNPGYISGSSAVLEVDDDIEFYQNNSKSIKFADEELLFLAIVKNNLEATKILLATSKININKVSKYIHYGMTAFHMAVYEGNPEIVKVLLERNPDITKASDEGRFKGSSSIHYAIQGVSKKYESSDDYISILKLLLDHGANVNDVTPYHNVTALNIACKFDNDKIVKYLLTNGADPEISMYVLGDKAKSLNAIQTAILFNSKKVLATLIERDVPIPDLVTGDDKKRFHTPIIYAIIRGNFDLLKILLQDKQVQGMSPIHFAVLENDNKALQILINAGDDVNKVVTKECFYKGMIPIHLAVDESNVDAINILLAKDKSEIDKFGIRRGWNSLQAVVARNNLPVLNALIAHGADVDKLMQGEALVNMLPIHLAAYLGLEKVIEILSKAGAKIDQVVGADAKFYKGKNALEIAIERGKVDAVKALVETGKFDPFGDSRIMRNEPELGELQRNCRLSYFKGNDEAPVSKKRMSTFDSLRSPTQFGNQAGKILEIFAYSGLAMSASVVPSAEVYLDFTRKFNLEKESGASTISEFCGHDSKSDLDEIIELPSKKRRIESPERIKTVFLEFSHENATTKPSAFLSPRLTEKSSEEKDKSKGRGVG